MAHVFIFVVKTVVTINNRNEVNTFFFKPTIYILDQPRGTICLLNRKRTTLMHELPVEPLVNHWLTETKKTVVMYEHPVEPFYACLVCSFIARYPVSWTAHVALCT